MATPVEVPKLGNTVEECLVSRWVKRKGDAVSAGDVVAEIETDKATFEVTAPVSGTVLETFFEEGALVPVFTKLFVIGEPGESVEPSRAGPRLAPPKEIAPEATPSQETTSPAPTAPRAAAGSMPFSPRARRFAEEHRFYPPAVNGSGPGGRVLEEDLRELYYSPRTQMVGENRPQAGEAGGTACPTTEGTALAEVAQAVPPAFLDSLTAQAAVPASPPAKTNTAVAPRATSIREKIARRMRESLASTAQYTLNASADAGGLLMLRARIKASNGVPDINLNDLVTFCAIRALVEAPALNAEFIDGKIHNHSEVHIGFACDTPRGLLVPVVRNAHELTIGALASAMKALTALAVQGSISPDYLSGATFTVSNLGGLGIESFTPLLNPPQVAILGVGAIQVKPVRRHGKVEFIDALGLSLTCDHQVVDGAPGARFLQVVKEKIENVERLCTI
jgi:pyruvate dehydrogenase E2 component (dihydrolipoamide acetyltransferase)